ncbi:MAG: STAS/SEC14 domain-containing protein [Oceanospirillaceae bacterium]|nr:STAS/SEC14 domain-containing protein [Oceanospirillaceae bacterium]
MFRGHGANQVSIQDNIISITLRGGCNEYDFQDIGPRVKQAVAQCNGKRFCILVNDLEFIGATPEAYYEFQVLNQWLNTQQLLAKAIVIKSVSVLGTIKAQVPAINDQNLKVFDVEKGAIIWLQNQLKKQVH